MGDIKIGNSSITLKLGSADVSAAYLGDTLLYSGGTTPTPSFKYMASYSTGQISSAECDSTSAITESTISGSPQLQTVEIGDCVTTLDNKSLYSKGGVNTIIVGSNVTSIVMTNRYYGTLGNNTSLTSVTFKSIVPPTFTSRTDIFRGDSSLTTIYVPAESVEAYKTAAIWSAWASMIQAIPNS